MTYNIMKLTGAASAILIAVCHSAVYAQSENTTDPNLSVLFQNTTPETVDIFWKDGEKTVKLTQGLLPKQQLKLQAYTGQIFSVQNKTREMAEYTVGSQKNQTVNVARLVAWQTKIQLVFQNTTDNPVDVLWVDENGNEKNYAADLAPGKEYQQECMPGESWTVRSNGELIAEYTANANPEQGVDLKSLIELYASRVKVVFQNRGEIPIDLYWVSQSQEETLVAPLLLPRKEFEQIAYPGQVWRARLSDDDERIGEFLVPTSPKSLTVDVSSIKPIAPSDDVKAESTPTKPVRRFFD